VPPPSCGGFLWWICCCLPRAQDLTMSFYTAGTGGAGPTIVAKRSLLGGLHRGSQTTSLFGWSVWLETTTVLNPLVCTHQDKNVRVSIGSYIYFSGFAGCMYIWYIDVFLKICNLCIRCVREIYVSRKHEVVNLGDQVSRSGTMTISCYLFWNLWIEIR